MKINPKALALSCGILWGVSVFVVTLLLIITGAQGKTISLLSSFYIGYSFSIGGAFIGLLWGFVNGLIFGFLLAWLNNLFVPKQEK